MTKKAIARAAAMLDGQAQADFLSLPRAKQEAIAMIILSNQDGRGRGLEVTTPPDLGNSHRYRWGKRH